MLYQKRHLRFLRDPQTGEALASVAGGVASSSHHYPIQDEIYCLSAQSLARVSADYDAACLARGWAAPDEFGFISLPQTILEGWGGAYWQARALSWAAVWEVLEQDRRARRRLPVGGQGVAAQLTASLPYAAYGLEVGGFQSYALSPHVGPFALGVYRAGRYARVQCDWSALPLLSQSFDVVVISGLLNELAAPAAQKLLCQALHLLAPKGQLFVTDVPEAAAWAQTVKSWGAQARLLAVKAHTLSGQLRSLWQKNPPVPPVLQVNLSGQFGQVC